MRFFKANITGAIFLFFLREKVKPPTFELKTSRVDMMKVTNEMVEYAVVFALSVITYLNAIPADFVFDDTAAIQANPDIVAGTSVSTLLRTIFGVHPSEADSHISPIVQSQC